MAKDEKKVRVDIREWLISNREDDPYSENENLAASLLEWPTSVQGEFSIADFRNRTVINFDSYNTDADIAERTMKANERKAKVLKDAATVFERELKRANLRALKGLKRAEAKRKKKEEKDKRDQERRAVKEAKEAQRAKVAKAKATKAKAKPAKKPVKKAARRLKPRTKSKGTKQNFVH